MTTALQARGELQRLLAEGDRLLAGTSFATTRPSSGVQTDRQKLQRHLRERRASNEKLFARRVPFAIQT